MLMLVLVCVRLRLLQGALPLQVRPRAELVLQDVLAGLGGARHEDELAVVDVAEVFEELDGPVVPAWGWHQSVVGCARGRKEGDFGDLFAHHFMRKTLLMRPCVTSTQTDAKSSSPKERQSDSLKPEIRS